ncbi:CusA/CzcA family heavy metal efflux RND transporter [Tellurirhabdus bombi]|uniref:CusA/CzcA family heavy metal efflux RND transporter n=1 Tax=Tellurirhabdus bombi TaxID=2907205 RepID=UPI001F167C99|nr:CusA/CzcA family heavy metal efflux RND transporter [Tellurirhabdus bombi]
MLDSLIRFSIRNKLIIGLATLALIAWGSYSLSRLPIDALPDITNNQVQIITNSPSLSALDVERLISFPIEQTMATLPDLEEVRSISRFGLSVVTVVFDDAVDIYFARQQVFERLQQAHNLIPEGVGEPGLAPVTTGLGEIYQYIIRPKPGFEARYPATELRSIQDWIVRRQLLGTPGVADVSSFGGYLKQYEVAVDQQRLRGAGVTLDELFTALEKNNQNTGGAYIDRRPNAYFIRSEGLIRSLADIGKIVVHRTPGGMPVLVRDVAQVQFGHAVRYGAMTHNGDGEVVGALVMMLKGANSSQVIGNVKERMEQIKKSLPEGVELHAFLDRTDLVNRAISTVERNLIEGALIVIFVLVILLGNWRAGLIVASVIPLAMLFAVSMMNLFGVSGNLMSLGAIDFGLIVDGAVIIVEATLHHLGLKRYQHQLSQAEMDEEVYVSASRIRSSAAFGEIIILIVYLPILALVGIEGKMFRPMAQTVAFAILGAFILSLTYVPMMSALCLSRKPAKNTRTLSDKIMAFFHRIYDPVIHWTLANKKAVLAASLGLFALTLWIFSRLGGEFIPQLDEGDFAVETRVMTGSSLAQSVAAAQKAGEVLKANFPEVKEVVGKVGSSEIPTDPMPIEATDLMVILKDRSEWTSAKNREELADKMQQKLAQIPGVSFGFLQPIQMRFSELISGVKQDVGIKLYGEDLTVLADYAARMGRIVNSVKGAKDLYVEQVSGLPQIVVQYDRDALARFGISIKDANRYVEAAFAGATAGLVYEGERRYDLVVRLQEAGRQRLEDVQNLLITTVDHQMVPLSQVAAVSFQNSVNQIQRDNAQRRITVAFNVRGRDVESVVQELQQKLDQQLKLPPGYYLRYGGQFQNLEEAKDRLQIAVPVALGLIFLLLFFTFKSVRQSLLIFSAIPLSAIGGVLALWLRGMPFSISAGVGFIALFGVAVLNGIVLIAEFNHLKENTDLSLQDIILQGTANRLRPVLMTALVASLGFLPMALATTAGAEVQRPLATVVIGGLVSATLLTLLVLPCLYWWEQKNQSKDQRSIASSQVVTVLILVGSLLAIQSPVCAQTPLTIESALQQAQTANGAVTVSNLNIAIQRTSRRASRDLGATDLNWTAGQYNSRAFDNNFTVSQAIPNPTLLRRLGQLADAGLKSSELGAAVVQNDLRAQVKGAYYDLVYLAERQRLLRTQDSLLTEFQNATNLRLRTGEGTAVEVATAANQQGEIRNLMAQTEADQQMAILRIQTLLNTRQPVTVSETTLSRRSLLLVTDSATLAQTPELALIRQQTDVALRQIAVEKARLLPSFSLGYFNQSLIGNYTLGGPGGPTQEVYYGGGRRFQGFMAGIALPVFRGPQRARIEAAELGQQLNTAMLALAQRNLQGDLAVLVQEIRKRQSSLTYYEQTGLPTAQLLAEKARIAFKSGDIDYLAYSQALSRSYQTRSGYIDVLGQHNQLVIRLEQLLGLP